MPDIDNPYLDTIISLVLVYATLSVLVSMINEWYVKHKGKRGLFLKAMIERMLNDPNNLDFGHMIYAQPAIARLRKDAEALPSYISADTFATALTDLIGERGYALKRVDLGNGLVRWEKADEAEPLTKRFRQGVVALNDGQIKTLLLGMADRCLVPATNPGDAPTVDLEALRGSLGRWFDDHMDRVSGEYKDGQRYRLFGLGLLVALVLNVDSIHLVRVIFMDEPLRTSLVQRAQGVADEVAQLPDSLKAHAPALAGALRKANAEFGSTNPAVAQHARTARDSALAVSMQYWLTTAMGKDGMAKNDSITAMLSEWGLPVGYAWSEPPLLWCDSTERARMAALVSTEPLLRYYKQRSEPRLMNWLYWIAGVLLSSLALSAGSAFWFATLVKLVNIRRAGAKPLRADEKKDA